MGTSRKSFIGQLTDRRADDRLLGTVASVALGLGGAPRRVHDVARGDVLSVTDALRNADGGAAMGDWNLKDILSVTLDIAVYFLVYRVFLIIKGTRAVPMLVGLMGIAFLYGVSQEMFLNLLTFNWLPQQFIGSILLVVVFFFRGIFGVR